MKIYTENFIYKIIMEIQKIFSDEWDDERLYSVLMSEEELMLFSEDEEDQKNRTSKLLGGAGIAAAGVIGGRSLGHNLVGKTINSLGELQISENDSKHLIKNLASNDVAVFNKATKNYQTKGPNAFRLNGSKKLDPTVLSKLTSNGKKVGIETAGWNNIGTIAHELGHAEHFAGRGSKIGRIAHNLYQKNKIGAVGLGAAAGVTSGLLMSDDDEHKGIKSAAIGGLTGLAATAPEILSEHYANKEGLRLVREKGGLTEKALPGITNKMKNAYKKQLRTRMTQRMLPALGVGIGSSMIVNSLRKKKKREEI